MYLIAFPLLLIPFVLYNMVAFLLDMDFSTTCSACRCCRAEHGGDDRRSPGAVRHLSSLCRDPQGDAAGQRAIMDHILSFVLFIVMIVEFIVVPRAADLDVPDADGAELRRRARRLHHHHPDRAARHRARSARSTWRAAADGLPYIETLIDARPRDRGGGRVERGRMIGARRGGAAASAARPGRWRRAGRGRRRTGRGMREPRRAAHADRAASTGTRLRPVG